MRVNSQRISGSTISTASAVSRMCEEKMVSVSGMMPICFSKLWPLVEMSTGMVADRPRPYMVNPV